SGCGKSSFLRAGVIPFLEEACVGYRFVRDRSTAEEGATLFVRTTNDLAGQLADALGRFCGRPLGQQPPQGAPGGNDLPSVLGSTTEAAALRAALLGDAKLLGRLLGELGARLSYTPVLVIDQGEEVFTLARTAQDEENRAKALEMLRAAAEMAGGFKIVL